jgi:hypothetical protein
MLEMTVSELEMAISEEVSYARQVVEKFPDQATIRAFAEGRSGRLERAWEGEPVRIVQDVATSL